MIDSILLTLILPGTDKKDHLEEIEEMKLLANTIGYNIVDSITQTRKSIDPATYFGKGKINQVIENTLMLNVKSIFFEQNFTNLRALGGISDHYWHDMSVSS